MREAKRPQPVPGSSVLCQLYRANYLAQTRSVRHGLLKTLTPETRFGEELGRSESHQSVAVALLGGDKTQLGKHWYPPNVAEAGRRLAEFCLR